MLTPSLYRGLTEVATPAILLALHLRRRRGKEDPARAGERRGIAGRARPSGPLIWMHAASVGEATSGCREVTEQAVPAVDSDYDPAATWDALSRGDDPTGSQ